MAGVWHAEGKWTELETDGMDTVVVNHSRWFQLTLKPSPLLKNKQYKHENVFSHALAFMVVHLEPSRHHHP